MLKIDRAKEMMESYGASNDLLHKCFGKKLNGGVLVDDPIIDEHLFCFSAGKHGASTPIYLDAHYREAGKSSGNIFSNNFYLCCLVRAMNRFIPQLLEETEKVMKEEIDDVMLQAKDEIDRIFASYKEIKKEKES